VCACICVCVHACVLAEVCFDCFVLCLHFGEIAPKRVPCHACVSGERMEDDSVCTGRIDSY